jgi:hypothetical protein
MQSVIRKIKSLPVLSKRGTPEEETKPFSPFLSLPQLLDQIDRVDELIDIMINESKDNKVLVFHAPNKPSLVPSEALTQRLPRESSSSFSSSVAQPL